MMVLPTLTELEFTVKYAMVGNGGGVHVGAGPGVNVGNGIGVNVGNGVKDGIGVTVIVADGSGVFLPAEFLGTMRTTPGANVTGFASLRTATSALYNAAIDSQVSPLTTV